MTSDLRFYQSVVAECIATGLFQIFLVLVRLRRHSSRGSRVISQLITTSHTLGHCDHQRVVSLVDPRVDDDRCAAGVDGPLLLPAHGPRRRPVGRKIGVWVGAYWSDD